MKKITLIACALAVAITLTSCSDNAPLTEAQQAEKYNMTMTEYKEMKDAAARMNMTIEEHMKMGHGEMDDMDHGMMEMDDSHMIEDDAEMDDMHMADEGGMMDDEKMHMEMMHAGEDIEDHGSDEHGKHE